MASLGKSNFSKLMSMLLSVIMVLSTMTFTLPVKVKAESKVLWEENFNFELGEGEEYYDISTLRPDWVATIVDSDADSYGEGTGTFVTNSATSPITWSQAATLRGPRVAFEGGKVVLKELRNTWNGGSKAELVIPMTFKTDDGKHPTTGYTVFEYDYYTEAPFFKDRQEEWGLQDFILYNSASLRDYARLSVTSANGIQDLLDSPVPGDGSAYSSRYLSSYYATYVADTNLENIRTASDISGKPVKMQIIYDLENMKYMVSATVDGEKSFRGNTWMDIPDTVIGYRALDPNINYFIDKIILQAAEAPQHGSEDSVASYDNMKYTHYTVLPEFVSSSVEEGDKDVPVSGTIDLEFSEAIDETSINGITLKAGNTEADVTVAMDGTDGVTVTYEGLSGNVDYTLTVPETVTNLGGLPISAKQEITFKTKETVPAVTSVTPADNSSNQLLTVAPEVTFSEAVDEETIDGITLSDTYGNVAVTRALSLNGKTVTLTPDSSLDAGATYTITVPETVKSLGGTALTKEFTSTFKTSMGGTVLWSENFDTITAENVITERSNWTASIVDLTSGSFNSSSESWAAAATDYKSKLVFDNGKLVLGQIRNTENGGHYVSFTMPMIGATHPSSGYAVLEYDYYSDAVPIRNRYNERSGLNDVRLYQTNGSGRVYGTIDITSTNGIQDMLGAGSINATTYPTVAAGTHKNNIRTAEDIQGKDVHMVVIFDIANTQYNIGAKVDGKYSFRSTDWVDLPSSILSTEFRYLGMTLKQNECNTGSSVWSEATYDNFTYTHYTTLPAFVSHNIADTADVPVTGSFDLTFDTAIDEASLNQISLKAYGAETAEEIELSMKDSKTVTVSYSKLSPSTPYTLTLPRTVVSNLGLPISNPQDISFTTNEFAAPEVSAATITDGAPNITLDKLLRFTFSEAMVPATASGITLKKQDSDVNLITGYEWSNGDTVVTLFHDTMEANATYTLEIPNTVVSASSGLAAYASYTFTTGDFATNVIWSENFDGLTEGRSGWTASIVHSNPANGNLAITRSIPSAYTWADAANTFVQKVQFTNDKLLLTKRISGQSHGGTETSATIPITTSSTPTSGYAVVEFDYMSTYFKAITASNHYNNDITLTGKTDNKPLLKLNIDRNYGVQDVLNPAAANTALTYATISAAPYVNNICSVDGLLGKKLHFQVVYDIENKKYMVSVTPEGGTRIVRYSDWIGLPPDITKIDFKQLSLNLKANSGSFDANAWYDNIKIWETSELPEIVTSTVEGNPEVKVDHDIVLRFTKPMNLASLNNITLTKSDASAVAVTPLLSNGGRTVLLSHPQLETGATYTLTVPATVTSELGLPLKATEYSFTTAGAEGDVAIDSATVTDGAKNIPVDRELTINFTDAVTEESVSSITLTKQGEETNLITDYTVNGTSVTLAHDNFDLSETYVLTVPAAVKSQASGIGITKPSIYIFTTLGEADVDVLWSENFDGRTAGNGDWSGTIAGVILTDGTINTSGNQAYTLNNDTENSLATHFTWAEAPTKYTVNGTPDGFGFENGRFVINKYAGGGHGSNGITVTMPLAFDNMPLKDYAVFEFDYFTTSMAKRGYASSWAAGNNGDVILRNSDNVVIARLQMSKTNGIQDLLNPAGGNTALSYSDISGSYKDNICEATDMENKMLHFKVVYDVENLKYLVTMTPEGGAPIVRRGGWQSLPAGTKINFNSLVFESKEMPQGDKEPVNSQYDNIKFSLVSDNPVLLSTSVDNSPEIAVNGEISLTFDEPVYDASLLNVTIVPNEGEAAEITGVELSNDGKTATLKHKHFGTSKTYTLTVPETVMSASGVPMGAAQQRTFTTDNVPAPTIDDATVTDNATGIAPKHVIAIQLSEAFADNTERNITLTAKDSDVNLITGYTLSEENKKVTLAHEPFAKNTQYVLTVPDTVKGVSGMTVEETVYNFTSYENDLTATINATGNAVDKNIQLELSFEEVIDAETIGSNVSLKEGDTPVSITPSPDGTGKKILLGNSALKGNTTYTVVISEGVKSQDGIPVEAATFTFTTKSSFAISTYRGFADGGMSEIARTIEITFNEMVLSESLSNITLVKTDTEEAVDLWFSVDANTGKTAIIRHNALDYDTDYTLTIPASVTSKAGTGLDAEKVYTFTTKPYSKVLWEENFTAPWNGKEKDVEFWSYDSNGWDYGSDWEIYIAGEGQVANTNILKISGEDDALTFIKEQNSDTNNNIYARKTLPNVPNSGVVTLDFDYTISGVYNSQAYMPVLTITNTYDQQMLSLNFGQMYYGVSINPNTSLYTWAQGSASESNNYMFKNSAGTPVRDNALQSAVMDGGLIHVTVTMDFDHGTYQVKFTTDGEEFTTPVNVLDFYDGLANTQVSKVSLLAQNSTQSGNNGAPITSTFDNLELKIVEDVVVPEIETQTVKDGDKDVPLIDDFVFTFDVPVNKAVLQRATLKAGETPVNLSAITVSDDMKKVTIKHDALEHSTDYTLTLPLVSMSGGVNTKVINFTTFPETVWGTNVLWHEDFDNGKPAGFDGSAEYGGAAAEIKALNKLEFVNGKMSITKQQKYTGDNNIQARIPITLSKELPNTGYVSLEFEYDQSRQYRDSNNSFTVYGSDNSKVVTSFKFSNPTGWLSNGTGINTWDGGQKIVESQVAIDRGLKVQVLYDLDEKKYMVYYTPKGGTKAVGQTGPFDIPVDTLSFGRIYVQIHNYSGTEDGGDDLIMNFDNFAIATYDKINVVETNVADTNVPVDQEITVTFDAAMDKDYINNITLTPAEGEAIEINATLSDDGRTVTFHNAELEKGTEYTISVGNTVFGASGAPATAYTKTFTTKYPTIADVGYALAVETDKVIYNAGETVTADIVATGASAFNSFGFTLDYDDTALQLTDVTSTLGEIQFNEQNGMVAFVSLGNDIELAPEGTKVATATFIVLDATGEKTIALEDAEMTPSGYDYNKAPTTVSDTINVYSIKVNFAAGNGVTLTEGEKTAYVKYGESTLYTDTTYAVEYVIPVATADTENGWLLVDEADYWKSGEDFFSAEDILAQTYTQSVTYTATAVKKFNVTIQAGDHGTFVGVEQTSFEVDGGTMLGTLGLPSVQAGTISVVPGYVFTGWKVTETGDEITLDALDTYDVTAHMTLVAQYAEGIFGFTISEFENGIIEELAGVSGDNAIYGTDITFKVTPDDSYIVKTVAYTIGGEVHTIQPDQFGYYTISGLDITSDVTVTVELLRYHTVTFKSGEGTTFDTKVAYVLSGNAGMYESLDSLKAQDIADFVFPTPVATEGYRVAEDTALEPLWTDGVNDIATAGFDDKTFEADAVYTAVAIRQYTVTFTVYEEVTQVKVDAGKKVTAPDVTPDAGYVLDGWVDGEQNEFSLDTPVNEDLSLTAVFKNGKYIVTFAKPDAVTVTYKVNIDGDGYAEFDTDVQFRLERNGLVINSVTYQVQGFGAKNATNVDGTYIIPGEEIVAPVTITIITSNVFTVTFETDGNGTVEPANAIVEAGDKIAEEPVTTPHTGYVFEGWYNAEDVKVNLLEEDITGDVTYTAKFVLAEREVSTPTGVSLNYEDGHETAQYGKDVIFTVASEKGVVTKVYYKVGDGEGKPVELTAENGVYTIDGDLITDNITITVTQIEGANADVLEASYNLSQVADKNIFMLETTKLDGSHYVFADGKQLLWSEKYGAYVAWVDKTASVESLVAGLVAINGVTEEIVSGDVNGDGRITAADAGIINDCLHNQRTAEITHKQIFAMDIEGIKNGEGYQKVTTGDIVAVLEEAIK